MTGLDTNVLVRYLVQDDKKQSKLAAESIRKATAEGKGCYINHIVLCELVWVLESAYGFEKKTIESVLEKILSTKQLDVELKDIVRQAVHDYRVGKGDFADYLIGRTNQTQGCAYTTTFDRALKNVTAFVVLE
jgi:predicted nucleic-acid-binding protein